MANIKFITLALTLSLSITACDSITPGETEYDERHPNYDLSKRKTVFGDGVDFLFNCPAEVYKRYQIKC